MSDRGRRDAHPIGDEVLLAFAAGVAGPLGQAAVAAHVDACPACAETVRRYRLVEATVREDARFAPSPAALARAKGAFTPPSPSPVPKVDPLGALRRVVAQLTFDGRASAALGLAGTRAAHDPGSTSYQVAYESEEGEVDLQVEPDDEAAGTWRLLGQVSTEGQDRPRVTLAAAGDAGSVVETQADADGVFDLVTPSGRYDLLVRLPDAELVLPDLVFG